MLDYINRKNIDRIAFEIANAIRISGSRTEVTEGVVIAAYLLYEAGKQDQLVNFQQIMSGALGVEEEILKIGCDCLSEDSWAVLVKANYSQADLRGVILYYCHESYGRNNITPASLVDLAESILFVNSGETVADIGCGFGSFITETVRQCSETEIYGFEIVESVKTVAAIRAKLLGKQVHVHLRDALTLPDPENRELIPEKGFDKIFANCPFGLRAKHYQDNPGVKYLYDRFPSLKKAGAADWLFAAAAAELLSDKGKAVCVMSNACLWNTLDKEVRKQFVEAGLIEAVIALPAKLFMTVSIPVSLIVLSHGNKAVRMIDASERYVAGRRQNILSLENVEAIEDAYLGDTDDSKLILMQEIRKNEYFLHPEKYVRQEIVIEDGVPFSDIIKDLSRGAQVVAKDLDEITSTKPTQYRYLNLSNIHDGMIDEELPYIKEITAKQEKYCIRDGTLILAKIGFPFKVGVAHVQEGMQILANGNLYIIDIDRDRADPVYVQAYLESEQGQAQLKAVSSGSVMISIGADALKSITIPLPTLEQQRKIRDAYLVAQNEVKRLRKRLETAQEKLTSVFERERVVIMSGSKY